MTKQIILIKNCTGFVRPEFMRQLHAFILFHFTASDIILSNTVLSRIPYNIMKFRETHCWFSEH